jgi:uncharacterized protein (DUF885 family)
MKRPVRKVALATAIAGFARCFWAGAPLLTVVGLVAVSCAGCRGERAPTAPDASTVPPPHAVPSPNPALSPDEQIEALVRADLDAELALRPTLATWLGDHGYDDRLDDVRTDAQLHEASRLRQLADALRAIPEDKLAPNARLDRRILQRRTEAALHELSELRPLERNPLYYVDIAQAGVESLVSDRHALDPDTLRALNSRLWRLRGLLDEARRNLRGGSPELAVRRAIDAAQALRAFLTDSLPRLVWAVPDARAVDDARAAIADANRALDEFAGWLQRDFQPRAHGDLALGPQRWWDRLRLGEAMPGSIEVLVPRVEAAVREAERRVDDATRAALAGAPGSPPRPATDLQRIIEDDHGKADELVSRAQQIADQLFGLGREHGLLPVPPLGLPRAVEMPAQLAGFVRLVANGPLEKRPRPPQLYIDTVPHAAGEHARLEHLRLFNRPTMVVTLAHDLLGHFLVGLARRQAPTLMQRVQASVLLDEGMAHYAEALALSPEGPFAGDVRVRLVVERDAQLRLVRLLASIRFHAQGARLEQVAQLFSDECGLDDYTARKEAERVALDPLAGAEALGKLEIERLRADWFAAHPDASLGAFHAALLSHGGTPIELVREVVLGAK